MVIPEGDASQFSSAVARGEGPLHTTCTVAEVVIVEPPKQDPRPDPYLQASRPWGLDLNLTVDLNGTQITSTNFAGMYWTFAQQLAHTTVNGATTRAGDLFGSGTVSGPTKGERGSLI